MKRTISLTLVFVLMLSAFMLAACKSGDGKDALNTTTPPTAAATTTASAEPTAEPETEAPTADPNPRPDPLTIEWLAWEMQRRYYVGCMNLELMDYSDIMDRNEDTDLFFWYNQLEIDRINLNLKDNYLDVSYDALKVQRIVSESDTLITADIYISMLLPTVDLAADAGLLFQITVDKNRMVIIAYSEPNVCSSHYSNVLVPLAGTYRKQGLPWEEADKKAYDEIYSRYIYEATAYPRSTPQ